MLRMIIESIIDTNGNYWRKDKPIEFDLQYIREKGICAFRPGQPETTYIIGVSNIYDPAEKHKLDYDAIISTPALCRCLLRYMRGELYEAQLASKANVGIIDAMADGRESFFPTFIRHDFWTIKHVAMISSVKEVKPTEIFLVNFDLLPDPEPQIYMIGWAAE